jgi:hypothetical protein
VGRTGPSACTSDYTAAFGKIPLAITELTGSITSLAGFAARLGLDLDTLDLLQTTMLDGMGERRRRERRVVRTNCHTKSQAEDVSCVSAKAAEPRVQNVDHPWGLLGRRNRRWVGTQGGAEVYLGTHDRVVFKRLCHILVKEDEPVDTLEYGRLPAKAETWKYNFKPATVERFELG